MNIQLANMSTDLRRMSMWIYNGKTELVKDVISKIKTKYKDVVSVGVYQNIWNEIEKIDKNEGGNVRSADRATTLGSIILQEALKT
jgi:hypothetical protein